MMNNGANEEEKVPVIHRDSMVNIQPSMQEPYVVQNQDPILRNPFTDNLIGRSGSGRVSGNRNQARIEIESNSSQSDQNGGMFFA